MGRGRGKGKKPTAITAHDDPGSGEEERIPAYRRRGRPLKPLKDDIGVGGEEEEGEKIEELKDAKGSITVRDMKNQTASENGKKRKRSSQVKENSDEVKENEVGGKSSVDDSVTPVGLRQNGSRRKSKPRRAAEVGIEC